MELDHYHRGGTEVRRREVPDKSFEGKMSARGQVVIPQPLREWAELREGSRLTFSPQADGSILMRRHTPEDGRFNKLRGAWRQDTETVQQRLREVRRPSLDLLPPEGSE